MQPHWRTRARFPPPRVAAPATAEARSSAVLIDPDQLEIDGSQAAVDMFGSVNTRFARRQQQLYNNLTVLFDPEAALTSVSSKISIHRCRACPICAPVENGGPPPHTA